MSLPKPKTIYCEWIKRYSADPAVTKDQIAIEMGIPLKVYEARWSVGRYEVESHWKARLGKPLHMTGDLLAIGDLHAPNTSRKYLDLAYRVARKHLKRPRRLVIGGDWSNQDAASRYKNIVKPASWQDELNAMIDQAEEFCQEFDEIYVLDGNHDRRMVAQMDGELTNENLMSMITSNPKFKSSHYGYCTVDSGGRPWRITHPAGYAQQPTSYARELALKYQTNVISFHEHHVGQTWDKYGRYVVVNAGCMADWEEFPYVMLDDNKSPVMQRGFVLLKNGFANLFGDEPFTDWSRWI